jgi:AraC-like DNA-binding protein
LEVRRAWGPNHNYASAATALASKLSLVYEDANGKWLLRKRLDYSAAWLRTSKMNVTEIAFESGFEDVSHFSRVFKERFDMPPLSYRQAGPSAE